MKKVWLRQIKAFGISIGLLVIGSYFNFPFAYREPDEMWEGVFLWVVLPAPLLIYLALMYRLNIKAKPWLVMLLFVSGLLHLIWALFMVILMIVRCMDACPPGSSGLATVFLGLAMVAAIVASAFAWHGIWVVLHKPSK